jgi:hypothetical protein
MLRLLTITISEFRVLTFNLFRQSCYVVQYVGAKLIFRLLAYGLAHLPSKAPGYEYPTTCERDKSQAVQSRSKSTIRA